MKMNLQKLETAFTFVDSLVITLFYEGESTDGFEQAAQLLLPPSNISRPDDHSQASFKSCTT